MGRFLLKKINDFTLKAISKQLGLEADITIEKIEFKGVMLGQQLFSYQLQTNYEQIPMYYVYMSYQDEEVDIQEVIEGFQYNIVMLKKLLKANISDEHYEYLRIESKYYFGTEFEDIQKEYPEETMDYIRQKIEYISKTAENDFSKILTIFIKEFKLQEVKDNIKEKYDSLVC